MDISASGLVISIFASNTIPIAQPLSNFSDDADPFDMEALTIGEDAINLNGDYISWNNPTVMRPVFNVVPGSPTDILLSTLLHANRVGPGKPSAKDNIILTVIYPGLLSFLLKDGAIISGSPGIGAAAVGRQKSRTYTFGFGSLLGIPGVA